MYNHRVATVVFAGDPVSEAGVIGHLRPRPEIVLVDPERGEEPKVAVVVTDEIDEETTRVIRSTRRSSDTAVVVVVSRLDDDGMFAALEAGACGLLRRQEATPEKLVSLVQAAANGDGSIPPDVLGRLLAQVGKLQRQVLAPRGWTMSGLTEREVDVLRLVAEGWQTPEIASKLSYSERTIKNVIHDVTMRLGLRNRAQAAAYAVREGLI